MTVDSRQARIGEDDALYYLYTISPFSPHSNLSSFGSPVDQPPGLKLMI